MVKHKKSARFPGFNIKYVIIAIVIVLLGMFAYRQFFAARIISADTTLRDFHLDKSKTLIVKNGAKVMFEGASTIEGTIACERGPLYIDAVHDITVSGTIICNRSQKDINKETPATGITLVIRESGVFTKDSLLITNAHLQIVESPNLLLSTHEDFRNAFSETAADTGPGIRIGPLFGQAPPQAYYYPNIPALLAASATGPSHGAYVLGDQDVNNGKGATFQGRIAIGVSVGRPDQPFPEWLDLEKVPKILDYILVWAAMPNGVLDIEDSYMFTSDGHDGKDIIGGCDINVPDMENDEDALKRNAMRLRGHAKTLRIRNFYLYLGDGGKGGDAITDRDCNPGKAVAGLGGNPANFKFTADEAIEIRGGFYIYPGRGGNGGKAVAYGRDGIDGCEDRESMNGADTFATGGNGAANPRVLQAVGNVQGLSNIFVGSIYGGNGGNAEVHPGNGGNANKCECPGGRGGQEVARPGKGGQVSLRVPTGVQRISGSEDVVGKDGREEGNDADDGVNGPKCPNGDVSISTPRSGGFFEFIDLETGQNVSDIVGRKPHIIVASNGNPDIQTLLPISLRLTVDEEHVWTGTISGDPSIVCRGVTGCSVDGPQIPRDFTNLTLSAYDKDGMLITSYSP